MSDEATKVAETTPVQTPEVDVKALSEQLEAIKRAQAGSDKAYQETAKQKVALEAELEKLKKEKMSEKEKSDYELKQKMAQLEVKEREVADASLRFSKAKILGEKNLPLDFAEYIGGANEEEIKKSLDTFIKRFDEAVGKRVNEKLSGTQKPAAGEPVKTADYSGMSFKDMDRLAREGKL